MIIMKKVCKIKFWARSRDHLERSDWSSGIMVLFAGRTTLLQMNVYGRTFHRGKSIEKHMRSLIIDDILSEGRNVSTEYYPGNFRAIRIKVQSKRYVRHMEDLLSNGRKSLSPC